MARSTILGNGSLAVGIDEDGLVHDFYYPYVGLENLNTARNSAHQIGVWVNGSFSWIQDSVWENNVKFHNLAMITVSTHINKNESIQLTINSYVDYNSDSFIRHVKISNLDEHTTKDVRIFFHQVFMISSEGRADTAIYAPDGHYILDYKGKCSLIIKAAFDDGEKFDQYAVGNFGMEGKEGTFRDAEDGELSMSTVEHAGVDSVLRLSCVLEPKSERYLNYWIVASDSHYEARRENFAVIKRIDELFDAQIEHWSQWLKPAIAKLDKVDYKYRQPTINSLFMIKSHIDKRGGIIASCDSSIYNYGRDYYSYVWPRDGAFVVWPLIRLGIYEEAKNFFIFCNDIKSPYGYMLHKYQPDKAIGSTWHPMLHDNHSELAIQEDETALVLFMLGEYVDYSGDIEFAKSMYESMIRPMAHFLSIFIDEHTALPHASYDLWEEKFLTSTFSTGATYKALKVSANFAKQFGYNEDAEQWLKIASNLIKNSDVFYYTEGNYLRKGYLLNRSGALQFDNTLDVSSLYGAFMFDFASSEDHIRSTAEQIEIQMLDKSPSNGTPRYLNDGYFKSEIPHKGNPWFVTTLWMAQYYNQINETSKSREYIDWALDHALDSGALSEQINPENGNIVGVTPLVWSHAELINTILDVTK